MKAPREFPKPTFFGKKLEMTNILFFSKITLVCNYNGGRRAEIALNNLGFLIVFYYTVIIKTRCSPASEFRNSETCDPPATARHERAGRGGIKEIGRILISVYMLWHVKSYAPSARAYPTTIYIF